MSPELEELLEKAKAQVEAMSPEEYEEMIRLQRESFVRGMMARCEHGLLDFEQCSECRSNHRSPGK